MNFKITSIPDQAVTATKFTVTNPTSPLNGFSAIDSQPQQGGIVGGAMGQFASNVNKDLTSAGQDFAHGLTDIPARSKEIGALAVPEGALRSAGAAAGGLLSFASDAVKAIPGVSQLLDHIGTNLGQQMQDNPNSLGAKLVKTLNEMAMKHPEITKDVGAVANIATAVTGAKGITELGTGLSKVPVAEVASDVANKSFIRDLVTPNLGTKDLTAAIKTGKVAEGGFTTGRDITGAVNNFGKIEEAVSEVPGLKQGQTALESNNLIHDHIGTVAQDLRAQLKAQATQVGADRGFFTPNQFKGYMNGVKQSIAENPLIVGDAEKTAEKILNKFESLVTEEGHTPEGLLNARQKLDTWMEQQKGSSVFDPKTESAVSIALRGIRQGGNDFLASRVPSVPVKALLAKQTALYDAVENIAPKAAKEGATGFQRFIKAHPMLTKAVKYGLPIGTAGVIGRELIP